MIPRPAISPPGANDFTCQPTAAHPAPVVLVHGTFSDATEDWSLVAPQITPAGCCVFALEDGNHGTGDIPTSAGQLERFVDAVLAATGGDGTPGAVAYTVVETRYDEVVTPFTSAFLAAGPNTANILLQDACPADVIDHSFIPDDRVALRWALRALGRPGPADPASPPPCA